MKKYAILCMGVGCLWYLPGSLERALPSSSLVKKAQRKDIKSEY